MIGDDTDLSAVAARLLRQVGRGEGRALTALEGGKNNRVYRLDTDAGPLVLKRYFHDPRDTRDRLGAEWAFLSYAWSRGVRAVPEPVAVDTATNTALLGFVAGRKLAPAEIGARAVESAADFILALNAAPRDPMQLAPGSEACFSIDQHLATVDRRVHRLATLDPTAPHRAEAERLVTTHLLPLWQEVFRALTARARGKDTDTAATLPPPARCVSPSDFGFHNALLQGPSLDAGGRLVFLDFEYAGADDPAKLACDFFCQPETPAPVGFFDLFLDRIADGLALEDADRARCRLLLDAYRVKWACIMLNEFLPLGAARRAFADRDSWSARCAAQLGKVEAKLSEIQIS